MRKTLTIFNSISGFLNRIASLAFAFIVRHYFAVYLDTQLLGLEGLFANILGLFSLVDLGLGTAISFSLYEPLHNNNRKKISAIMALYRKLYIAIGVIIFLMALCFSPFIIYFIKDSTVPANDIRLYFLLYAFSIAVTYFFAYKRTLIFALQQNYIVMNVDSVTKVVLSLIQIFFITKSRSYTFYLIASIVINLAGNFAISIILDKANKYDKNSHEQLSQEFKDKLKSSVKSLAISNVAWQGIESTDNIIISSLVGVIDLAKNANYSTISSSISNVVSSVLGGVSASIGDLLVEDDKDKIKKYFDRYCFIYFIIAAYAALGVYFVSKPLISVWVGKKLVFETLPVLLISINICLSLNFKPVADYLNYTGTFKIYTPYSVISVGINIVASIVFVKYIGISGVFLGTTLTYTFMTAAVVIIVYKHVFQSSALDYYKQLIISNIPLIISFIFLHFLNPYMLHGNYVIQIIKSAFLVTVVYFGISAVVLHKYKDYAYFKDFAKSLIKGKILKKSDA